MQTNLAQLEAELVNVLAGLDARQCQLTPIAHPEKWNIQQIVEHLLMSYRSTGEVIQARLDRRKPTKAKPSIQQRLGQFTLITLGYFPRGIEAPPNVLPSLPASLRNSSDLTRRIHEALSDLAAKVGQAHELFGRSRFASHIVLGSLSAPQWARFHLIHGRHHIKQIRQIRRDHSV